MKKSTKKKEAEAPAVRGGARNVDEQFVRAMMVAATGALSAVGVCFAQAAATCPAGDRKDAMAYCSKLALMFAEAAKVVDDDEGLARVAQLAAELHTFRPCGEEVRK